MKKHKTKPSAYDLSRAGIIIPDEKYYKKILIEGVFINPSLLRTTRYDRNSRIEKQLPQYNPRSLFPHPVLRIILQAVAKFREWMGAFFPYK